ncbi:hypothetical protein HPB51_013810 [Rhipicephalus microplus]|uniref:CCHC-type domain-containing protein n=1 Tax=Rhipicephalus microplus TaxID=6941 RepID=A0A9J6F2Y9_RHIMP|nr:hypothetical protein HPB51_013810 [Rhipicephalus microplus]
MTGTAKTRRSESKCLRRKRRSDVLSRCCNTLARFQVPRWAPLQGLLSNTLGFRSTRSRGSLSGHSAAITSRTIGQRLPVPTWLAHTRSGMSEPEAVSVQHPMAGSHPGPGDSPRSNGSTFSPEGDRALLDVDLQNAPVTSVPAIPDVTNIQLPAAAGEAQNGRLPAESGQMMQASFHRVIAHQKQIHDILFDASCKVPNTHRSQIIGLLRQIVQECADIRAIAENQGGRMDELRHQLALSRHSASLGAALSASRPVQTAVTYAAAAARSTARPTVVPPVWPETCSHPVLPSHWSEIADQHTTHTTRREHEHIMFLTPLIPSTNPANEVTKIIKSNIDPMRENIGELTIRKTRHGLTILTNDHNAITRLKNALEKNAITSMSLSVRLPQKRKPRVKLTGVDSDIPAANIISQLNMRNPNLHLDPTTCRVAVSYKERSGNFTHVLEVDPSTCRSLLAQERVLLGWTACSVSEDFHVPLCTYCATYGHTRKSCPVANEPDKVVCTKCTGTHLGEACTLRNNDPGIVCNECQKVAKPSSHPTGHEMCPILRERVARMRARTDYG